MAEDVIIIGGGAAGLSAAIYASRRAMKTRVVTEDVGGQAATTQEIENYPGVGRTTGPELMLKFKEQAERFGARITFARAERVEPLTLDDGDGFRVTTNQGAFEGKALIIAQGLTHRHLDVPGEAEHVGRGVSYCATCDAPLFKGKPVAVIGGGNSALDAAVLAAQLSPIVYHIHRSTKFTGEAVVIKRANALTNIKRIVNAVVKEIRGGERVSSLLVADVNNPTKTKEFAVEGVFIEVGYVVNPKLFERFVDVDARKQIATNPHGGTSRPGVFAAGDITVNPYKQIVISAGEGAKAALQAYSYLQSRGRLQGVAFSTDWGYLKK